MNILKKNWAGLLLGIFVVVYIFYFSIYTVYRYKTLYASYFDLGIMHQTVFNTYKAISTGDFSRFLELTNPYGPDQIKRMAIHNDLILALLAPFYFIHSGPATLVVLQTIILALGAIPIYLLTKFEFRKTKYALVLAILFSLSYLLFSPMEHTNQFDFHGVALATTFLLYMFYFWFTGRKKSSFVFLILSLLTKEEVGLTCAFFGLYCLYSVFVKDKSRTFKDYVFGLTVLIISLFWSAASISFIIPLFRGGNHFAIKYFSDYGDSPFQVVVGFIKHPVNIVKTFFSQNTFSYFWNMFGPVGFFGLLSPGTLIALPELGINLISSNDNMRNIIYHYSSVVTPFVFIGSIFAAKKITERFKRSKANIYLVISGFLVLSTVVFAYYQGPLPFTRRQEIHPFKYPQKEVKDAKFWSNALASEKIKVAATGQLSPFFTSRRYFYTFSQYYSLADYVVIRPKEILEYPEKKVLMPIYTKLKQDKAYELIYQRDNFEVYKKIAYQVK